MHNLKSRAIAVIRSRHQDLDSITPSSSSFSEDINDALNDLQEADYLIRDLSASLAAEGKIGSSNFFQITELENRLNALKTKVQLRRQQIQSITQSNHVSKKNTLETCTELRTEFLRLKSELRLIYKQTGAFLCGDDWQSPIYDSSFAFERNRLSNGIAEHIWDYKRDGHLDALAYESQFNDEYCKHLGSDNAKVYLTNSGMAAFTTVLNWLSGELQMRDSALAVLPMYFENLHLARAVFPGLAIHSSGNNELKETLNREQPSIIFIDAVSNCNEVVYHDLARVTSWAKTQTERQIAIVIDTTCLPLPLLQSGFLKDLPDNVMVAFVESLAKYHQFGMDAVTGGAVLLHAAQEMQDSFRKTRARIGTNIVDTSVGSLPRPSRELFIQRMDRHSRNTKIVCQKLSEASKQSNGIFDSVSWLDEPPANAPWFHASCFTLHLRKEFRSINFYQELEKKVLELCQKYGHPIAFSTSFGFDVSRLYVTAPATRFEEPFLRVSVGTETLSQIHTFVKILEECNKVLAESWKNRFDASPNSRKVELRAVKAVPEQNKFGFKNSVFAGPEGLHNYLCPENYAPSPMVELPSDLNPFAAEGVRLMAKVVPLVPLMNIKSIPAYSMLAEAAARGDLNEVANVIESSSSNTVLSLSVVARLFGIDRTCAIVDHSIAPGLMRMLRLFGIEIFPHPAPGHELFGVLAPRSDRATRCGSQPGWFNPGQYSNKDNPAGFERYLAPEIWNQTDGKISILSCALGTCGTMVGVSRGLRSKNPDIKVVACCPAKGEAVPGPREKSLLHDVTFDWHDVANAKMELGAQDSFKASIKLLRRGLMAGPSSGMNYAGALQYISELKAAGELDSLRNEDGEIVCAFLCCDSPLPHVDEYFDALGDEFFPTVHPIPEAD